MRTPFVLFLFLALPIGGHACSCLGNPSSFDLYEFDRSYDVLEVTILDARRVTDSLGAYRSRAKFVYDSLMVVYEAGSHSTLPPPPPPPPPSNDGIATAVVHRAFKEQILMDTVTFLGGYDSAACQWLPTAGVRYIIYLNKPYDFNGQSVFGVSSCQRKLSPRKGSIRFVNERSVLMALSDTTTGSCEPAQTLIHNSDKVDFRPFSGIFKDGLRDGVWSVNLPVMSWRDTVAIPERPALRIVHDRGQIVSVEMDRSTLQLPTQRSHKYWIGRYHEYLQERQED